MAKSANLACTVLHLSPHFASAKPNPITVRIVQACNNAISATGSSNKSKQLYSSPLIGKTSRAPRRLITISTGDGKWHGEWTNDYKLTLQDLQLQDLVEVEEDKKKNAQVLVSLSIQKHASFGMTVDANIMTSFTRKCSTCSSPYCRQVIYVKPGYEADLDSLIQDTIRLNTPIKDTCSESCEKSEATLQYTGGMTSSSIDKRWSRLYELKKCKSIIYGISKPQTGAAKSALAEDAL